MRTSFLLACLCVLVGLAACFAISFVFDQRNELNDDTSRVKSMSLSIDSTSQQPPSINIPGIEIHVDPTSLSTLRAKLNERGKIEVHGDDREPLFVRVVRPHTNQSIALLLRAGAKPISAGKILRGLLPTASSRLMLHGVRSSKLSIRDFRAQQTFLERNSAASLCVFGVHDDEPLDLLRLRPNGDALCQAFRLAVASPLPLTTAAIMFAMARLQSAGGGIYFGTGVRCEREILMDDADLLVVRASPSLDMSRISSRMFAMGKGASTFCDWALDQPQPLLLGELLNLFAGKPQNAPHVVGKTVYGSSLVVQVLELSQTGAVMKEAGHTVAWMF